VLANISGKTEAEQDEYLSAADMVFTTISPLADLLELSSSGSSSLSSEQNRCLAANIAKLKQGSKSKESDGELQAAVAPFADLAAASAVPVTHENFKQYTASVTDTLCWKNCLAALNAMRDGQVLSLSFTSRLEAAHTPSGSKVACLPLSCATCTSTTCALPFS
jgi:hypothetical protein